MKSIAVSLSSSNTISDSREHTPLLHGHVQCRIHRRRCQLRAHRKDLVISNSGGTCHVGITAFVVPAPHGPLWISSDVLIETRQLEPKSPWHFHHEARHCRRKEGCLPCGYRFSSLGTGVQNSPCLAHFHRCPCLVSRTLTFR